VVQVLDGLPPANSPPVRVDKLPGEGFRYSGGGYTIMQLLLTDVEGKPFPDIMQEQVLGPLQMTHSTYEQPLPADKLLMAATGYVPDGTMTKGERHTYPEMAAAGLWTTAEDLARFAIDIQRTFGGKDGPVLGTAAVREMLTPYHNEETGLGIFTENRNGEWYFGHGGWDEGFSAQLIAHRDKGYGVVVLTNSNHPPFIDELIRSVAMTYGWDQYVSRYTPLLHSPEDVKRIAGRYRYDSDGVSTVYEKEGKLYYQYTGWKPMRLYKVTDSTYARRERTALIQFMENSKDGAFHLVFRDGQDSARFEHPRMNEGEKVPYEWFVEGDFARAASAYAAFVKQNPEDRFINEGALNRRGYDLLEEKKFSLAKEMFRINMALYPSSANVYDSYAEACMKNGDTEEAINFYKKTLAMQPDNPNAVKNLETLEKK
jgi:tetratricopeptide (TPR) repeat protein